MYGHGEGIRAFWNIVCDECEAGTTIGVLIKLIEIFRVIFSPAIDELFKLTFKGHQGGRRKEAAYCDVGNVASVDRALCVFDFATVSQRVMQYDDFEFSIVSKSARKSKIAVL